jgi:hypothetical protein
VRTADLIVDYNNFCVWTATKNEVDPGHYIEVDFDFETEVYWPRSSPPLGMVIPVQSSFGPVKVTLDDGAEPLLLSQRTWTGKVEFLDETVYVESFDQTPDELFGTPLPRGAGVYDVTVDWWYTQRHVEVADQDVVLAEVEPQEYVTVRFR